MKKFNKKQISAIDSLVTDLDELSNKPRRFFSSLEKVVYAFSEQKNDEDKLYLESAMSGIRELENDFYKNINHYRILEEVGRATIETRKNLINDFKISKITDNENELYMYKRGVEEATKQMALIITKNIIIELY